MDAIMIISHQERILDIADEIVVIASGTDLRNWEPKDEILPELLGTASAVNNCNQLEKEGEKGMMDEGCRREYWKR